VFWTMKPIRLCWLGVTTTRMSSDVVRTVSFARDPLQIGAAGDPLAPIEAMSRAPTTDQARRTWTVAER